MISLGKDKSTASALRGSFNLPQTANPSRSVKICAARNHVRCTDFIEISRRDCSWCKSIPGKDCKIGVKLLYLNIM